MGWSSATEIFDGAVDVMLRHLPPQSETQIEAIVKDLYQRIDWQDWDTQDESKYFFPYLVKIMCDLNEIDQQTYEELTTY